MSGPDNTPEKEAPKAPELTLQDHYIGIIKLALEFNASVVSLATQIIAMDPSGHNRTTNKRVKEQLDTIFTKYKANVDYSNQQIIKQFFPKDLKAEGDDSEHPTN